MDGHRAEAEVRQRAEGLFLRHQLFATRQRDCVLLFASEFERQLVILPDAGVRDRVGVAALERIVAIMRPELAAGRTAAAFATGLSALEALLAARGFTDGGADEIPERLVQEGGQ